VYIKNFPTEIEHCIEYGKIIFTELFDLNIREIKIAEEDQNKFYNILGDVMNNDDLFIKLEFFRYFYHIIDKPTPDLIITFEIFVFKLYFEYNIIKLLKEQEEAFTNPYNKKPAPIKIDSEDETNLLFFKSFYYILSNVLNFERNITDNKIKLLVNQTDVNIKVDKLEREELINNFKNEIINKINNNINNIKEKIKLLKPIIFEKDDDENNQINFILSFSNLRANNYNINKCDFLKAKEVAGNIIPAIASTTAAITGLCCLQIYTLLQTDNIRFLRSGAINLATNEYDLSIPEEKRYITDKAKTDKTPEYKVIPKEFTVWDKIDIIGPNITVKTIVDDFKNKYNVDIDFINYSNDILSSPFEEDEDLNKTIEELIINKTGKKINDKKKYIKLNLNASRDDCEILTPTIRYILKS
jgi:ubiquitin-activating enzyme E1